MFTIGHHDRSIYLFYFRHARSSLAHLGRMQSAISIGKTFVNGYRVSRSRPLCLLHIPHDNKLTWWPPCDEHFVSIDAVEEQLCSREAGIETSFPYIRRNRSRGNHLNVNRPTIEFHRNSRAVSLGAHSEIQINSLIIVWST